MRAVACPVCEVVVSAELVSEVEPFNCPNCDELLRAVRQPGNTGWWIVHIFLIVLVFTYRLGFASELALAVAVALFIAAVNLGLNRIMGYELEPVGHIPLGGLGLTRGMR